MCFALAAIAAATIAVTETASPTAVATVREVLWNGRSFCHSIASV
jgi:hypothetical protein